MATAVQHYPAVTELMTGHGVTATHSEAGRSDITLLLERPRAGEDGNKVIESVSVLSNETIASVKLKLRARKQWFTAGHSLVSAQCVLVCSKCRLQMRIVGTDRLHASRLVGIETCWTMRLWAALLAAAWTSCTSLCAWLTSAGWT